MTDQYRIHEVRAQEKDSAEQMGSRPKFWVRDAKTRSLALFKLARPDTGEDWSEKIAAEIAGLLGIPHATVELASLDSRRGILSMDFTGGGTRGQLVHGNEILYALDPAYPLKECYNASEHTVDRVKTALTSLAMQVPPDFAEETKLAQPLELFLGYLLLDALIGNTDRHHENWGVLVLPVGRDPRLELAPTFDHASSLGRELSEETKRSRLSAGGNRTVEHYAKKARSALYATPGDKKALLTIDAFSRLASGLPKAYSFWISRLGSIGDESLYSAVQAVPESIMSSLSKEFTHRLLAINKQNILSLRDSCKT